jgi:hypothetical protein
MFNLLDKMFIKRFCLPANSDIELYENGSIHMNSCLCGHYNHAACILQGKGKGKSEKASVLSFGMNQMGDSDGIQPGIHAEQDAINKLQPLKYKKNLESINILVIRLSSKNNLQSSKPCASCISSMKFLPIKKGYKIQNVYYSDSEGNIIKTNLTCLDNEEKHYSRFYKQKNK